MKKYISIIFLFPLICFSQNLKPERSFETETNFYQSNISRVYEMACYNAAFNGLVGGIGAAIHHKPEQRTVDAFLKGFYKGAISSAVMSAGKGMTSLMFAEETYLYGWPAKLTNSLGASMLENTIQNKPLLSNYGIDLSFIRVDINNKIQVRLMPYHAAMFAYYSITTEDVKFQFKQTMLTGNLSYATTVARRYNNSGFARNNMVYVDYLQLKIYDQAKLNIFNSYQCYSHETVHAYQDRNFTALNYFWSKQKNKYFFWDIPFSDIFYSLGTLSSSDKSLSNPFEYEAEYTSRVFRYGYAQ